ncbi:MAG TPA: hypothetical protein VGX95_04005 [Xanthobacteraceae bacterium]|jgi:hypothetical protein|nr:hypothetical protein [Xanthobacteraceae bacterium]
MPGAVVGPAADSAEPDPQKRLAQEVRDARRLLDYAVETGWGAADGRHLDDALILAIKETEDAVGSGQTVPVAQRVKFEHAYLQLAALLAPITARSLRDTSGDPADFDKSLLFPGMRASNATIWSRKLTLIVIAFLLVIFCGEVLTRLWGEASARALDTPRGVTFGYVIQVLLEGAVPFTYGGLGACAYLLRSLHEYIYKRSFDANRKPEYLNRIVLGFIAGGAITLFVSQIPGEGEDATEAIQLSAKALGFLAGYNTDLLFTALERVAAAILPKVGIATVQRESARALTPVAIQDVSLTTLLEKYEAATDPADKALYRALIERLQTRL